MTGQLNTNLLNSNSEEIQEELDTLSNRLDGVESVTSANTDKINEVDNRVDNLANCVSTDSLNATNVAACNINGSSATITGINANNVTVSNKLKAANIEADNITGTINGNVSANTIDSATANIATANVTEKITAASAEITSADITNANITNGNISALCTDGIATTGTITSQNVCVKCDINVDGCIIGPKKIATPVNGSIQGGTISGCNVFGTYVQVKCCLCSQEIYGNVEHMCQAYLNNACIHNLDVKCSLTLADGITLPNTLGDTTLTKVTTNCLLVNGNTELNGAVKAGSITIGDGSITAGEVRIGAKGIVIDKDKNGDFNYISANDMNVNKLGVPGKILADCIELLDSVVSKNVFAKNFYPENITIDKDVGDLHYSRQLDTDAVGGILVDCKTVTPKEGATGIITKYKDSEANTINTDSVEYVNEKNGIKVVSCSTADKTSNAITLDTGTNVYSIKADETGFGVYAGDEKAFGVNADGRTNLSICKCTGSDTLVGNIVKLDKSGNLYTGRADGLSDGAIVDGVCSNTLKNTAINIDSNISRKAVGYNCYYNCYTRHLGSTENKIYDYCKDSNASCNECSYDITATTDCVITTFCNCCTMTGGTSIKKEIYELYPRMVCHRTSIKDANSVEKTDNLIICHSPQSATYLARFSDVNDGFSWQIDVCDSNLRIVNPSRITDGVRQDILRVEDGKIYTKCGKFKSGGYFEDDTFSNDCISGTRSVVNDTITTCVAKSTSSGRVCYSFETVSPNTICFGYGYTCSCRPENNYCKSYLVYNNNNNTCVRPSLCYEWSSDVTGLLATENYCYNIVTNDCCHICSLTNKCGNYCCYTNVHKTNDCCTSNYICCEKNLTTNDYCCQCSCTICTPTCYCCDYYKYSCIGYSVNSTNICCLIYKGSDCYTRDCTCCYTNCCFNSDWTNCTECTCYNQSTYTCCSPVETSCTYICTCKYRDVFESDKTEVCLGYYHSYTEPIVYNYICNCGTLCGCSYEYDSGSYSTCYICYPQYDCTSQYTRYFNGDCLCGCKYNTSTCQYECFTTCSCVSISDSSIYKYLCINNSCVSLKEKVVNNQIANLPITNTLVPLAGTVNGNGFAFFCKGADGIKFYDGAFAVVDAGTATDVTYLVTTGI